MTLPSKDVRKITINNRDYRYVVKGKPDDQIRIVIQTPEGKQYPYHLNDPGAITPSYIEALIKDKGI